MWTETNDPRTKTSTHLWPSRDMQIETRQRRDRQKRNGPRRGNPKKKIPDGPSQTLRCELNIDKKKIKTTECRERKHPARKTGTKISWSFRFVFFCVGFFFFVSSFSFFFLFSRRPSCSLLLLLLLLLLLHRCGFPPLFFLPFFRPFSPFRANSTARPTTSNGVSVRFVIVFVLFPVFLCVCVCVWNRRHEKMMYWYWLRIC